MIKYAKECWINVYDAGGDVWYGLCYPEKIVIDEGLKKFLLYRIHVRLK